MKYLASLPVRRTLALATIAISAVACNERAPFQPGALGTDVATRAAAFSTGLDAAITTLRRATVQYKDLDVAVKDGFVLLHPCETRPDEGPVGAVYVHMGRLLDGVIDPLLPDALIYAPDRAGRAQLVGVEFALPYSMWTDPDAPDFLGQEFQPEDEFGVWALHVWVWRQNPNGLFAESHPAITCGA